MRSTLSKSRSTRPPFDRLLGGDQANGGLVDRDLESVDLILLGHHLVGERLIALNEDAHGEADHGFGQRAHDRELFENVLKLFVEVSHRKDQPKRPLIKASVLESFGLVKRSLVGPYSIRSPSRKNAVRSATRAAC